MACFTGTVYPDRTLSIGAIPRKRKRVTDKKYDSCWENQYDSFTEKTTSYGSTSVLERRVITRPYEKRKEQNSDLYDSGCLKTYVLEGMEEKLVPLNEVRVDCLDRLICPLPLFIETNKSSRKRRKPYGANGITKFGRRFVKNACILLERKYGKRRLGFATATLPGMGRDTCARINGSISDITRRFYQKIRRKYQKRGSEFIYVGCVEIQEDRFRDSGLAVPHLHFVFVAKDSVRGGYTLDTKDFYTSWNESVNECLIKSGSTPIMGYGGHKGSVKLESIRSSAAAYIGKYLSKGVAVVKAMQEAGFKEFPKQWWTACMQTKRMFKASLIKLDTATASAIFYGLEHYIHEGLITWAAFVTLPIGGIERTIGLVANCSPEFIACMQT